jgi:hypothetical protein
MLFEEPKELHERSIIDKRLYEWGDELRTSRLRVSRFIAAFFLASFLEGEVLYIQVLVFVLAQ